MLDRIRIKNYQCYRDETTLEFAPGLNFIVGSTDSGKSAIVRALRFVCLDELRLSRKEPDTIEVTVETNGHSITRTKGSVNKYVLDGVDYTFNAHRRDIPEHVSNALQMDEINFQHQKDMFFLLNEKPGEAARQINEIVNISDIDRYIVEVNTQIRENKTILKQLRDKIERSCSALKSYDYYADMASDVSALLEFAENTKVLADKSKALAAFIKRHERVLTAPTMDVSALKESLQELKQHRESLKQIGNKRDQCKRLVTQYASLPEKIAPDTLEGIKRMASDCVNSKEQLEKLERLINRYSIVYTLQSEKESELQEYLALRRKFKTCPICKQELPNE